MEKLILLENTSKNSILNHFLKSIISSSYKNNFLLYINDLIAKDYLLVRFDKNLDSEYDYFNEKISKINKNIFKTNNCNNDKIHLIQKYNSLKKLSLIYIAFFIHFSLAYTDYCLSNNEVINDNTKKELSEFLNILFSFLMPYELYHTIRQMLLYTNTYNQIFKNYYNNEFEKLKSFLKKDIFKFMDYKYFLFENIEKYILEDEYISIKYNEKINILLVDKIISVLSIDKDEFDDLLKLLTSLLTATLNLIENTNNENNNNQHQISNFKNKEISTLNSLLNYSDLYAYHKYKTIFIFCSQKNDLKICDINLKFFFKNMYNYKKVCFIKDALSNKITTQLNNQSVFFDYDFVISSILETEILINSFISSSLNNNLIKAFHLEYYYEFSNQTIELIVVEYFKFLALGKLNFILKREYGKNLFDFLCPSSKVDQLWHYHQANQELYEKDCFKIFNFTLYHTPAPFNFNNLQHFDNYNKTRDLVYSISDNSFLSEEENELIHDIWNSAEDRFGESFIVRFD